MSEQPSVEGVVGTWFVDHGEKGRAGERSAEDQVDKRSQDVEAPVTGTRDE